MDHRLGDQQPPLHAARQRARIGVGLVGQVHRGEQRVGLPLGLGHAVEPGLDLQRLARSEEGVEQDLLRDDADRALGVARVLVDVEAPDVALPPVLITSPARMLISVDLPAPLGPSRPKIWPRGTSKLTSSSAALRRAPLAA